MLSESQPKAELGVSISPLLYVLLILLWSLMPIVGGTCVPDNLGFGALECGSSNSVSPDIGRKDWHNTRNARQPCNRTETLLSTQSLEPEIPNPETSNPRS